MRVLENVQVYRARLNGGQAPLTLVADLKRGGYGHGGQLASANQLVQNTATPPLTVASNDTPPALGAASPDGSGAAVVERPTLERGEIKHKKTQAEIMNPKASKIKAKAKRRPVKSKRRKS